MKKKSITVCESCKKEIPFELLDYIEVGKKGKWLAKQHKKPKVANNTDKEKQEEAETIYVGTAYICKTCRHKKEFVYWKNRKVSVGKLRVNYV